MVSSIQIAHSSLILVIHCNILPQYSTRSNYPSHLSCALDREDLFEDGKPVVNARSGAHCCDVWALMPQGTYLFTGILEPMRCMSYFPVIIKTAHLKEMREFISRHHNGKPFNEVFRDVITAYSYYSQFNIMCAYLFHYHRDDYKWYVHTETPLWYTAHGLPIPIPSHCIHIIATKGMGEIPNLFKDRMAISPCSLRKCISRSHE